MALSIVGTERRPDIAYFRAKIAQEDLIATSSIPYSILHATQFFEFVNRIADDASDGNRVRLPPVLFQPVAADDVAEALAKIALGAPLNGTVDLAGPERFRFDELVRKGLSARHDPREVVADADAQYFGAKLGESTLVPIGDARLGQIRFDDWLGQAAH